MSRGLLKFSDGAIDHTRRSPVHGVSELLIVTRFIQAAPDRNGFSARSIRPTVSQAPKNIVDP